MGKEEVMDAEEIVEKVKNFLENKAKLGPQDAYFITKRINAEYWDDIQDGGDVPDEVEIPELDDFEIGDAPEDEVDEEEDIEVPPAPAASKKGKGKGGVFIKKPKIVRKNSATPPGDEF